MKLNIARRPVLASRVAIGICATLTLLAGVGFAWGRWGLEGRDADAAIWAALALAAEGAAFLGLGLAIWQARQGAWARAAAAFVLWAGCSAVNVWNGHAVLHAWQADTARTQAEGSALAAQARTDLARIDAARAGLPALPAVDGTVNARRLEAIALMAEQRARELARLDAAQAKAEAVLAAASASAPVGSADLALWVMSAVLEALKALGFFAFDAVPRRRNRTEAEAPPEPGRREPAPVEAPTARVPPAKVVRLEDAAALQERARKAARAQAEREWQRITGQAPKRRRA